MGKYTTTLGKWTMASLLLTTPILTALPVGDAQAATTTVEVDDVQSLLENLPAEADFKTVEHGEAFYEMQLKCDELTSANKKTIKNSDKYKVLYEKIIVEMRAINSEYTVWDSVIFTRFLKTFELKILLKSNKLKPFDDLTLADKKDVDTITNLQRYVLQPYFDAYVKNDAYSYADLTAAGDKIKTLNAAQNLTNALEALPKKADLTLTYRSELSAARSKYNSLMTTKYLALVTDTIEQYEGYKEQYIKLEQQEVADMTTSLAAIGTLETVQPSQLDDLAKLGERYKNLLFEEAKSQFDNDLLGRLQLQAGALKGKDVEAMIQKLGSVDAITLENEQALIAVAEAYADLPTANAKGQVESFEIFLAMQTRLAQLKTAQELDVQISTLTATDFQAISTIRQAIDKLDEAVVKQMKNYDAFVAIEAQVTAEQQQTLINELNTALAQPVENVEQWIAKFMLVTEGNRSQVTNQLALAKKVIALIKEDDDQTFSDVTWQYMNQLSAVDKKNVAYATWEKYVAAKQEAQQELEKAVDVQTAIYRLPLASGLETTDIQRVKRVAEQYDALTKLGQDAVSQEMTKKLDELLVKIATLQQQQDVQLVMQLITELPNPLTMNEEAALKNIRLQYDALPAEQQDEVINYAKLVEAEQEMVLLKEEQKQAAEQALETLNGAIEKLDASKLDLTEEAAIQALREQYDVLTADEKKQITAVANLEAAEQRIESLLRAVTALEDLINTINPLENPALIAVARSNYELLSPAQQQRVRNIDQLTMYEMYLETGTGVETQNPVLANKVMDLIKALPADKEVVLEDQLQIQQARESYEQLTAESKAKVTNLATLMEGEAQLAILQKAAQQKVAPVSQLIAQLPKTLSLRDEEAVQVIRNQVNMFTIYEQSLIENLATLFAAEDTLNELKNKDVKAVQQVELLIAVLPEKADLTLSYASVVAEAQRAYEKLTTEQQQRITAYDKLQAAVKKMAILQMDTVLTVPTMTNMTKTLKGKATPKAKIYIYIGGKRLGSATVSEAGNYKVVIPRQKKGAVIKYIVKYDGEELLRKTVKVKAARVKTAIALKATNQTITGKAKKSTTVKVYKGSKRLKTVKTTAKGTFKATIATQKKGTKLKVYVYDVAGNRSAVKTVVVK
ncbi:Ig-like domain-containing protein [Kurthia gibsonii]|uniref:Ig-like domain-containing protein n=1 Tax=Kurthia gibsonii TaxID=33946 RepID=UPI002DB7E301|nr:Ig-like domain-containing protein [Kurthia gibsonii]MEB7772280.1 Ig-like domain-containing protein [Kurthia gibsonii]